MSYASALFCQYFADELRYPGTLRVRITRAMERLSPTLTDKELRIYTTALHDTIKGDDGKLRPDWRERIGREH